MPGLTTNEAVQRLTSVGYNELPRTERRSALSIVWNVLHEPMFALLLAATAIYFVLGEFWDALILSVFMTLSVVVTIVQEIRSEHVLDSLRQLTSPRALVIRDNQTIRIPNREVVPGDWIVLMEGDRVPADALVIEDNGLMCDESLLTGEAVPVSKRIAQPDEGMGRAGGDHQPFVFSGSLIVRGQGKAVVQATGRHSEIGKIGAALGTISAETPRLRQQTRSLVRVIGLLAIVVSAGAVLLLGLLRGSWLDGMLNGIAISMSMIPEEFPLVLTVFMVMGAWRISKAKVLTRHATAIETLGSATILCTDKTGTLTENRMTICQLLSQDDHWIADQAGAAPVGGGTMPPALEQLLVIGGLACSVDPFDPMEKAFHDLIHAHEGLARGLYQGKTLQKHYGLSPELLAVTQVWQQDNAADLLVACKGAPEAIAGLCRMIDDQQEQLHNNVRQMAAQGVRVLAVATASFTPPLPNSLPDSLPNSPAAFAFRFLGLIGLADPLRAEARDAVAECHAAGIRVIMITGDYPETARAIARQVGINHAQVMTGEQMGQLDDDALAHQLATTDVFARIMPEQKLRLVNSLKAAGQVVAMTGDGVNDAPSLKAAHIGIAMGQRGTDVAREAADIVLLNDDFGSIVTTIRLGRRIYDNLRKAIGFILAVHIPIAGLAIIPLLFGMPLLLTPLLIAFIEMVIDPICSIVLEAEREEANVMQRPPRSPSSVLFSRQLVAWSLLQGGIMLAVNMAVFTIALHRGLPVPEVRALSFLCLVMTTIVLVLVNRSFASSLRQAFVSANRMLWWVLGAVGLLLLAVLNLPMLQAIFRFGAVHAHDWLLCLAISALLLLILERLKPLWGKQLVT
ncbi:MAG: cation-translocating P-type ATPase [Alphaproteobacteria bacterium]|nr:cation-translocating P-type ATPase [Alphaproteobacteria bacterium]